MDNLSDLSFSEDEDEPTEVGWSHNDVPVNVAAFNSLTGATSTVPKDGTAKDLFCLFVTEEMFEKIEEETNRYARHCIANQPNPKWYETNMAKCKHSLACIFSLKFISCQKQVSSNPRIQPSVLHLSNEL